MSKDPNKKKNIYVSGIRRAWRNGYLTPEQAERCKALGLTPNGTTTRAVICYETGELFESVTDAEQSIGLRIGSNALRKHGTAGGYHWYYADQPKPDPATFKRTRQRAVVCYETGKTYNTPKEAAEAIGQEISSCIITAIKKGGTAGGYHWYYADEPRPDPALFKHIGRPVICYETGERFESAKAAGQYIGLKAGCSISNAIKSYGTAGGYHWYYADQPKPDPATLKQGKPHQRKVICYETGKAFESLRAAAKAVGIKQGNRIKDAIKRGTACGGYHWYYADEPRPDPSSFAKPSKRRVRCVETGERFPSLNAAAQANGLCNGNSIRRAIDRGGIAVGFHWKYDGDDG